MHQRTTRAPAGRAGCGVGRGRRGSQGKYLSFPWAAWLAGRDYVTPDDVRGVAHAVPRLVVAAALRERADCLCCAVQPEPAQHLRAAGRRFAHSRVLDLARAQPQLEAFPCTEAASDAAVLGEGPEVERARAMADAESGRVRCAGVV